MNVQQDIGTIGRAGSAMTAPAPLQQAIDREQDLLERFTSTSPTPRFQRLKQCFLDAEPTIEIDRDRIYTRVMKETDGEPMVTRRAKAFAAVVRQMPVVIAADELLVGHVNVTWMGHRVTAEAPGHMSRLLEFAKRRRSVISEADERELREQIMPFWQRYPSQHFGHLSINSEKLLAKGLLGVKRDAEERLSRLDRADPNELRKVPFLEAVIIALEAAAEVGVRFADEARRLATIEQDASRQSELVRIAEICEHVPAHPARDFREALQSLWFSYILLFWETMATEGFADARTDQYLQPYLESDIAAGTITRDEVQELLNCWVLRLNIPDWTLADVGDRPGISSSPGAHLSVGGYQADGRDATNELSFMMLESAMHVGLPGPHVSLQVHSRTPEDLLIKACQLCALGYGHPQFENADVLVPGIMMRDTATNKVSMEDARGFASVGCQEPMTVGNEGLNPSGILNAALAFDLALNNGKGRMSGEQQGVITGDPRKFTTFDEVREGYLKQMAHLTQNAGLASNQRELHVAANHPTAYCSALVDDCIENGVSREEGGARYNAGPGLYAVGLPDNADSLAAIKKVVFEDCKITMAQLCDALDANFEGYDEVRQLLRDAPKYGNDIDEADEQMVWLSREWAAECRKLKNTRGGQGVPGMQAFVVHAFYGREVGARASGRLAGEQISDGASPCAGNDVEGPTAVLKSLAKVNNFEQSMTDILNMTLDPGVFRDDSGLRRLAAMIRTLVDEKIQELQINVVSPDTLRAAQREPDKYRGIVVKVAGYNAFFVKLTEGLQNAIIARTEHSL
jgi:formate C-acetyltransferase